METEIRAKKHQYISLTKAAEGTPYSQEYLSLLVRKGKLHARKLGRNWYTTKAAVDDYIAEQQKQLLKKVQYADREDLGIFEKQELVRAAAEAYSSGEKIPAPVHSEQPAEPMRQTVSAMAGPQAAVRFLLRQSIAKAFMHVAVDSIILGSAVAASFAVGNIATHAIFGIHNAIVSMQAYSADGQSGSVVDALVRTETDAWQVSRYDLAAAVGEERIALKLQVSKLVDPLRVGFDAVADTLGDGICAAVASCRRLAQIEDLDNLILAVRQQRLRRAGTSSHISSVISPGISIRIATSTRTEVRAITERREVLIPADLAFVKTDILASVDAMNKAIRDHFESEIANVVSSLSHTSSRTESAVQMITLTQKIDQLKDIQIDNGATIRSGNLSIDNGAMSVSGNITADTLTLRSGMLALSTSTFTNLSVSGNTTLGDASSDLISVNAGTVAYANSATTTIPNNLVNVWSIATSTAVTPILTIDTLNSRVGIGTTSPGATFSVAGNIFASGILTAGSQIISGDFTVNGNTTLGSASTTSVTFNSGTLSFVNPATSTIANNTVNAWSLATSTSVTPMFSLDTTSGGRIGIGTSTPRARFAVSGLGTGTGRLLTLTDSAGTERFTALDNGNLGIGTTTPNWLLQVNGTRPSFALSDSSASANLKHWLLSSMGGNLYIGTSTDVYATSTPAALTILNGGNIGIGTTTPAQLLSIAGSTYITGGLGIGVATTTSNNLQVQGDAQITGALSVTGITSLASTNVANSTTTNATTTSLQVSGLASTSQLIVSLGIGVGNVSTSTSGAIQTSGPVQIGGVFNVTGASSLNGNVILGNTSSQTLTVNATSTFAAGVTINSGGLSVTGSGGLSITNALYAGGLSTLTGGILTNNATSTITNLTMVNATSTNATSTTLYVSNQSILAAAGGSVGVGTSTPNWLLQVNGTRPSFALSDSSASANLKHWLLSSMGGNLYIGTSTDVYATSTPAALTILNGGNIGIGTTTPAQLLSIAGSIYMTGAINPNGGNIGIGQSSPQSVLDIAAAANTLLTMENTTANATTNRADMMFQLKDSNNALQNFARIGAISTVTTAASYGGTLAFYTAGSGTGAGAAGQERMRIDNIGRIGIGTTTPNWIFQISSTTPSLALSDSSAGVNLKHWLLSSMGGNLYIGTSTDVYATSTPAALTILNNGNVGIGTTTPNWLLQIAGTRPSLALSDTNAAANKKHWLFSSMEGNLYIGTSTDVYATSTPPALTILNGGNVGVGIASPATLGDGGTPTILQVHNATNVANSYGLLNLSSTRTTSGELVGQISFGTTGSSGEKRTAVIQGILDSSGTGGGALVFGTNNAGTIAERMRILGTGNLGIGTTTPNWLLQIAGTRPSLALSDTNAAANKKHWLFSSMEGNLYIGTSTDVYATSTPAALTILNNGNIGIGTTTPRYKLDVYGGNSSAGDVYIGNWDGGATYNAINLNGLTGDGNYNFVSSQTASSKTLFINRPTGGDLFFTENNNSTPQLIVKTAGNVGIGTTNPGQKLVVQGNIDVAGSSPQIYGGDSLSAPATADNFKISAESGLTTSGSLYLFGGGSGTVGNVILAHDGSNQIGNVGIGTTNPVQRLQLGDTTAASTASPETLSLGGTFSNSAGSNAKLRLWTNVTNVIGFGVSSNQLDYILSSTVYDHVFYGSTNELMRIKGTGNVGIGTTTPVAKLSVQGSGTGAVVMGELASGSTYGALGLASSLAAGNYNLASGPGDTTLYINRPTGRGIQFRENNVDQVIIQATSGNVGIGTTGPAQKLHVVGNFRMDSGSTGAQTYIEFMDGTTAQWYLASRNAIDTPNNRLGFFNAAGAAERMTLLQGGNVGIGVTNPGAQLDLSTDSARKLTTTTWSTGSDARIKTDVQSINNALDVISKVRPVQYHYTPEYISAHPSIQGVNYYNFIAQEYQQVFPDSITETDGLLYLNSSNMIPYAIAGVKAITGIINLTSAPTTTPSLVIDSTGNIGIGTSTPDYKLRVEGDIAAQSFINISTRNAKEDIVQIDASGEDQLLKSLLAATTTHYQYASDPSHQQHLGLIAEDAPEEIKSANGKGIDLYKMSTALLAGLKSQQRKIEELDGAITQSHGTQNLQTNAWSVDQQSGKVNVGFMGDVNMQGHVIMDVGKIIGSLGRWSIDENGTLMAVKIITDEMITKKLAVSDQATFGSREHPIGITVYDQMTGDPYCIKMKNGAMVSEAGECGVNPQFPISNSQSSSNAPMIKDIATSPSTPAAAVVDTATSTPADAQPATTTPAVSTDDAAASATTPAVSSGAATSSPPA